MGFVGLGGRRREGRIGSARCLVDLGLTHPDEGIASACIERHVHVISVVE